MEIRLNPSLASKMHIDLNSCFASVEQQANPLWRGKPLVVAAYDSPGGCVLSPSIEAKKFGIKTGFRVKEAKELCPNVIVRMPDPPKYHFVHDEMMKVFRDSCPKVIPKSIDEALLDFEDLGYTEEKLIDVAISIKDSIKRRVGDWLTVSVGIAPNRFLAKLASGLHKPDGLDVINAQNLVQTLAKLGLVDLPGINVRYEARLNANGIFTPLDFLRSGRDLLQKQVFVSIVGYYWFQRLRGFEIDNVDFLRRSFGQEYAIGKPLANPRQLSSLLYKLCEKMGRRLREGKFSAHGIHLACSYEDQTFNHRSQVQHTPMYSTKSLFVSAQRVLNSFGFTKKITKLAVSCYDLTKVSSSDQLCLFDYQDKDKNLTEALDKINNRFGEYTVKPLLMLEMEDKILERVAFKSYD